MFCWSLIIGGLLPWPICPAKRKLQLMTHWLVLPSPLTRLSLSYFFTQRRNKKRNWDRHFVHWADNIELWNSSKNCTMQTLETDYFTCFSLIIERTGNKGNNGISVLPMEEFTQWLIDSWYFLLNQDKGYFIFSHSEETRKEIGADFLCIELTIQFFEKLQKLFLRHGDVDF